MPVDYAGLGWTAPATGPNPATLLPPKGRYQATDKVGEHVSTTLSHYAKLILKVGYNRGADLMTCLAAVRRGSTNCEDGLTSEVQTASGLGVPYAGVIPMDGAGSDDQAARRRPPRVFMIAVGNVPTRTAEGFFGVVVDQPLVAGGSSGARIAPSFP